MAEENKKNPLISIKFNNNDDERFKQIHTSLVDAQVSKTMGDTLGHIIDKYLEPVVVKSETEKLNTRIKELEGDIEQKNQRIAELEAKVEADTQEKNEYAQQTQRAQLDLEQAQQQHATALAAAQLQPGMIPIFFSEDNLKALDYVCNRESRRRKQPWSRSHVVNHFIFSRFIKGELNGDIASVPDSILKRLNISTRRVELQIPNANQTEEQEQEQNKQEISL